MGWASEHIAKLRVGETVSFRPWGKSMEPHIKSGQLCTVSPVNRATLQVDDVVLCRVRGRAYLHFVKEIRGERFMIGNARGFVNGWISSGCIYGKLVHVTD